MKTYADEVRISMEAVAYYQILKHEYSEEIIRKIVMELLKLTTRSGSEKIGNVIYLPKEGAN